MCSGLRNSCRSYVTFRSTPFYASLVSISYLFNSQLTTTSTTRIRRLEFTGPEAGPHRDPLPQCSSRVRPSPRPRQPNRSGVTRARSLLSSTLTPFRSFSPSLEQGGFLPDS
ncbi:uncharacterized protein J3R85_016795 [Psidium guajava]|nr:uncharacterized protein J3R85_016795 [Psidium guajava]